MHAGLAVAISLLCAGAMTSCDKEDDIKVTPVAQPSVQLAGSTVSTLSFSWDAVSNATQYAYKLDDSQGTSVSEDVTTGTMVTISDLEANTEYTFSVWAYGEYLSENGTSSVATLTAKTVAINQLATPVVTVDTGEGIVVSWTAVEDAYYYEYAYTDDEGNVKDGWTYDTSVSLTGLSSGSYVFTVYAVAKSSDEAHSNSEKGTAVFEVAVQEVWRVSGTFDDGLGNTYECELVSYDDGTYALLDWYGKEGTKLMFSVNEDNSINVLNPDYPYESGNYYWYYDDSGYYSGLWPFYDSANDRAYSEFSGDATSGSLWCYEYYAQGSVTFTWNASGDDSLWRVIGTYSYLNSGTLIGERELVANKDGSYTLKAFDGYEGYDLTFTVSGTEMIISNSFYTSNGYVYVGSSGDDYYICLYPAGYSEFSGDQSSGYFWCWDADAGDYIYFVWDGSAEVPFIDQLVGTYSQVCSGYDGFSGSWVDLTATNDVTIEKVDDSTVKVTGMNYETSELTATVDGSARTMTFEPQTWLTCYTFAAESAVDAAVTVTVSDDFVIALSGYNAWYSGYTYMWEPTSTLTKK